MFSRRARDGRRGNPGQDRYVVLRARGEPLDPVWESAARRNLEAAVDTATRFGHLGYSVDRESGDVLWGDSACGAFGIEPLVRGADWFGNPVYLKTANRLAEYYAARFLAKGYACGGVGDALMEYKRTCIWLRSKQLVYVSRIIHYGADSCNL